MKPKITESIKRQFHSGKMKEETKKLFDEYYNLIDQGLMGKGIFIELDSDLIGDYFLDGKTTDEVIEINASWYEENQQTVFLNRVYSALCQKGIKHFDKFEILEYYSAGLTVDQILHIFED